MSLCEDYQLDCSICKKENSNCPYTEEEVLVFFRCRDCGTKYPEQFTATKDVSLCRWCSSEEED